VNLGAGIAERLRELGIEGKVPYHGDTILPLEIYRDLAAGTPAIEWVPEHRLLYSLFGRKSPRELDAYRTAGEIASRAMDVMMDALLAGERECDAAAKAAAVVVGSGGGFQRIACHHGPRSEVEMWNNPLYGYSTDAPKTGDMVRAWVYGPIHRGYWIDPGRTSVCGRKPNPEQRRLIENSVTIVEGIMAAHRPGVTAREIGAVGDKLMLSCGYELDPNAQWALYGHSISGFWMEPIIPAFGNISDKVAEGWRVDEPFHVGQVCTVEIFLPVAGVGQAAFEQVFILEEDGIELLTTTPMLFW
jgi:Xaa-Pro aminopeptidase